MSDEKEEPESEEEMKIDSSATNAELREAEQVNRLREEGFTLEKISERLGISESTVRRRLDLWDAHIGRAPADKEEADRAASIIETVFGFLDSEKTAEKIGEVTGADVATVQGILKRIFEGKATKAEISRLIANIKGSITGFFGGSDAFRKFEKYLPTRVPIDDKVIERKAKQLMVAKENPKKKKKVEQAA